MQLIAKDVILRCMTGKQEFHVTKEELKPSNQNNKTHGRSTRTSDKKI